MNTFAQKCQNKEPVGLLIVGDSISEPAENWPQMLAKYLEETYHTPVTLTNVSMGGNGAYAGYIRAIQVNDGVDYDLVIFCHGQNDGTHSNGFWYEAMIRICRKKYPNATMISVLESSQRTFTETIQNIQKYAEHYGIYQMDAVTPFNDGSHGEYEPLTYDGTHPNPAGQAIYAELAERLVDRIIREQNPLPERNIPPIMSGLEKLENAFFVGREDFVYDGDVTYTYTVNEDLAGDMGIDYYHIKVDPNKTTVAVDGKPINTLEFDWTMWPKQRHISHVGTFAAKKGQQITVTLTDKEAAEGFGGICISTPEV